MLISNRWRCRTRQILFCLVLLPSIPAKAEVHQSSSVLRNFFVIERTDEHVRVSAKKELPTSMWQRACRYGLTQPLRDEVRNDLAVQVDANIPEHLSYAEAHLTDFSSWNEKTWLYCKSTVTETYRQHNLAALAIRFAWDKSAQGNEALLRSLLKLGLSDQRTRNDAIVLVAVNSPPEAGIEYLDAHLDPKALRLETSRIEAMKLYFARERLDAVLAIGKHCQEASCDAIYNKAYAKHSEQLRSKAQDINSFFEDE